MSEYLLDIANSIDSLLSKDSWISLICQTDYSRDSKIKVFASFMPGSIYGHIVVWEIKIEDQIDKGSVVVEDMTAATRKAVELHDDWLVKVRKA